MDEKISIKALEDYSDDYASKVTASFFSSKEKIKGAEILKLCDIHQINLFVIRELLHAWRHESQKLRSPFFDYSSPEVTEGLTRFQILLSNHISISKESFQPLLKKAVTQTLFLILDPYDFYSDTLDNGAGGMVKIGELRNDIKYVKINKTPLERLLQTLDEKKLTAISGNEAFALLDRILEEVNFTPEDIDQYIAQFSVVIPFSLDKFYDHKIQDMAPARPVHAEPIKKEPSKFETIKLVPEKKEELKKTPVSQTTLYDQFSKGQQTTLADDFQKRKKIKDSLTINQKFMFTKILFNGDFELFSTAIDQLDELDDLVHAKSYLVNNYSGWGTESEEYLEFMEMVEKRFA